MDLSLLSEHRDYDVVLVSDYEVQCIIGILPKERVQKQSLLFSFALYCLPNLPSKDFELSDSINYAEASLMLSELAQKTQAGTLEYLAKLFLEALFKRYGDRLVRIELTLKKPNILNEAKFVGIKVVRNNPKLITTLS